MLVEDDEDIDMVKIPMLKKSDRSDPEGDTSSIFSRVLTYSTITAILSLFPKADVCHMQQLFETKLKYVRKFLKSDTYETYYQDLTARLVKIRQQAAKPA